MNKKHERYLTVKSPKGYKIIKQEYLGDVVGKVNSIRIFFELENVDKLTGIVENERNS